MGKKFIHTIRQKGTEYAYVYTPCRVKGKKDNKPEYLGRVIDKGKGIYQNGKRGRFKYDLEGGYSEIQETAAREEKLILNFGDAYSLNEALKKERIYGIICEIMPERIDTMMSILGFKLLGRASNRYAEEWWEGSYMRIIYPEAKMQSQRLSEFYSELGDESVHREFFSKYLRLFGNKAGVLIDSTGMPNDINFPLTAVNTHNGVTSNESRLLYVVDRKSRMPLFFRYNAGNIVDVATLRSTIAELEAFGVDVEYAIVDAGYYSENNVRSLYGDDDGKKPIPFLTRLGSNLKLYKNLAAEHADDLSRAEYMLMQRDRLISVKRVEVDLFGHIGYAYVALDYARRGDEIYKYAKSALSDNDISRDDMDAAMRTKGLFILISSEEIDTTEVMPLYYTRQTIEQVFDVSKNYTDLLPFRVHNESTFRGHLMLSFISTIVFLYFNQLLKDTPFNADGAFLLLSNQKCKVFDDCILPKEPSKKMNDIYKILKIIPPFRIPILW